MFTKLSANIYPLIRPTYHRDNFSTIPTNKATKGCKGTLIAIKS